jgi:hypothetical protein
MSGPQIVVDSLSAPEAPGYCDKIAVCNGELLYHGPASCCPNPRQPLIKGGKRWALVYAWIAPGLYWYECIEHPKRGRCLLLNGGGVVATRNYNVKHAGRYMTECMVHCGWSKTWRGSAGCITVPPSGWSTFIENFAVGDVNTIFVRGGANV